jgi:hypothetical protein
MAIVPQMNLFEYSEIERLGDLERLKLALEGIADEILMRKLETKRGNGRDDYPVRVMWNLIVAMKVFGHNSVESLRRELARNSQLRKICGLYDEGNRKHLVPPARVFSCFFKLLCGEQEEIDRIFEGQVSELYGLLPSFGRNLAGDGKYIDSVAKRKSDCDQTATDKRTENDARWSVKEYHSTDSKGKKQVKKEHHFGFKAHIICDVETELPVAYTVTAANGDERKEMKKMLYNPLLSDKERRRIAECLLLDRGYDSMDMIKTIKGLGIAPLVDIRNSWKDGEPTKQYKDTSMVYDYRGTVYYVDEQNKQHKMKYEGYDKQKKCLRYSHEGKIHKIYISYDERVFLPIARDSDKFKKLYKGRTSVERLNGRLDRDYMFEDHSIRGLDKMTLMVGLSLVIMNGMAIGKLKNGKIGIRSLKTAA